MLLFTKLDGIHGVCVKIVLTGFNFLVVGCFRTAPAADHVRVSSKTASGPGSALVVFIRARNRTHLKTFCIEKSR